MDSSLDRLFALRENQTSVRTEVLAGTTTFLTMAYFIFVLTAIPAAAAAGFANSWQVALGVVFVSGVLFLLLSWFGVREAVMDAISPSFKCGITVGIGLFIAFIGLQNAGLILKSPATGVTMNHNFASADLLVFLIGLLVAAGLHARGVRGSILWGITVATLAAVTLKLAFVPSHLHGALHPFLAGSKVLQFNVASGLVSSPPSIVPTLMQMEVASALDPAMWPFILVFLFMVFFDTVGTLIGVGEQAGLIGGNKLVRAKEAFVSDALGTTLGACLGTSTVTSYIQSAAGVEQGGRTGLTASS